MHTALEVEPSEPYARRKNNFMVLKVAPPLVVTDAQLDAFVPAIREVVEIAHSAGVFWSEALGLARRAFRG